MAFLKCKMCGGELTLDEGLSVCTCAFCGSKQTVPNVDDEKKIKLFERANALRLSCEFDRAYGVFESIIEDFPKEAEAYWGLLLCKYGIEYVDDPKTEKKIPTCHRSSFDSLFDDELFDMVMETADSVARTIYRDEAKQIEQIREKIIELSSKEEPYDIFICYKESDENGNRTLDSVLAQDIYSALTKEGYKVFFARISLESKLGLDYEPIIFSALHSSKVMLSIGTTYDYFQAVWVKNEWSRFLKLIEAGEEKTLIPCFKDIDAYDLPKEFRHLQAQNLGKIGAIQDLLHGIKKIVPKKQNNVTNILNATETNINNLLARAKQLLQDSEFKKASEYFEKILEMDMTVCDAYIGLEMAENKLTSILALAELHAEARSSSSNINHAKEYNNGSSWFDEYSKSLELKLLEFDKKEKVLLEQAIKEKQEFEKLLLEKENKIKELSDLRCKIAPFQHLISASKHAHTLGVKSDGTVLATGNNADGQCNVKDWKEIIGIFASHHSYTVGLKANGTALAIGANKYGQCNVRSCSRVKSVATGLNHTACLKADGTVWSIGCIDDNRCNTQSWKNIVAISASNFATFGLKNDGTVIYCGKNEFGECNVQGWSDIVAISAGCNHTIGLKSDGTVLACGQNDAGQCDVANWSDIIAISAGQWHTVGLRKDGTIVVAGINDARSKTNDWTDIIAISAGGCWTVGLKKDGHVLATGTNTEGQCNVNHWKLFDSFEAFEEERKTKRAELEKKHQEAIDRQRELRATRRSSGVCQHCGGKFKGIFSKICSNCSRQKDY